MVPHYLGAMKPEYNFDNCPCVVVACEIPGCLQLTDSLFHQIYHRRAAQSSGHVPAKFLTTNAHLLEEPGLMIEMKR